MNFSTRIRPFRLACLLLLAAALTVPSACPRRGAKHAVGTAPSADPDSPGETAEPARTYAERLGWSAGSRVVILHVDDAGMSHDSNAGTIEALEKGVATSASIMMPCSWVPEFAHYWRDHPTLDIGLHLTLTSEWQGFRWGPLAGAARVPGLVDPEGCLWRSVTDVLAHAQPTEVEAEIRAQIARAEAMGLKPTHLDTHMWALMESALFPTFLKVGREEHIPILAFAGHRKNVYTADARMLELMRQFSHKVWTAGLPVLDELHIKTLSGSDEASKKKDLLAMLHEMRPGVAQIVLHCTRPSDDFRFISSSGRKRQLDLEIATDPEVRECLRREGIIQTTWRELAQRRIQVK